jgi:hypothetical protein
LAKYKVSDGAARLGVFPKQYEGTIVTVAAFATAVERKLRRVSFVILMIPVSYYP